jgi:nicotinate dehydrogenase subunit A
MPRGWARAPSVFCAHVANESATQRVITISETALHGVPLGESRPFSSIDAREWKQLGHAQIMQSAALLTRNPKPTEQQIKAELANNLCRCGTHLRIVRAVKRASSI